MVYKTHFGARASASTLFKASNVVLFAKGQGLSKHYFSFTTKFERCEFDIFFSIKNNNN